MSKNIIKRKRQENSQIGGKPVGLAKSGKNPVLNILNTKVRVDAKVLSDGIDRNQETGQKRAFYNLLSKFGVNIDSQNERKEAVANKREKAAV